jgi:DNA-binding MurR/RpiR family transcriptional regulator
MVSFSVLRAQDRIDSAVADTSPSLSRVGQWMSNHPIRTLSHSAEEIASLTGTSVAAINRFSRAAGFDGFTHLKTVLGDELQSTVEPLRKLGGAKPGSRSSKAKAGIRKREPALIDGERLNRAAAAPQIQRAAGRMLKARQVSLLGLGTSSFLAGYAAHLLMPYLPQVWTVSGEGGTEEAARRLSRCARGDVLVAISLPRYSKDTVRLAEFAHERGAHIVGITDVSSAPLAAKADTLLLAPGEHPLMPSSALGAVAVIEAIATAVMRLNPDAARIAFELSELVVSHLTTQSRDSKSRKREEP